MDITQLIPTHRLHNNDDHKYCATIQYGVSNKTSWPHFDYHSDADQITEFLPDMHLNVMEEYERHKDQEHHCNLSSGANKNIVLFNVMHKLYSFKYNLM